MRGRQESQVAWVYITHEWSHGMAVSLGNCKEDPCHCGSTLHPLNDAERPWNQA